MEQNNNRRVVITGMGIWSCLGTTLDEVKESLFSGKSGIIFSPERKEMGLESGLTASVKKPELKGIVDRAHRVFMPEEAQYAYMSTVDALKMANSTPTTLKNTISDFYSETTAAPTRW